LATTRRWTSAAITNTFSPTPSLTRSRPKRLPGTMGQSSTIHNIRRVFGSAWRLRSGKSDAWILASRRLCCASVDEGLDLKKWEGSPLRGKRAKALAQARAQILAEQPQAKPLPKPLPLQLPGWQPGEIVGVRLPNGRLAVLHMIRYRKWSIYGVKAPVVTVLNWTGVEPPNAEDLEKLTYINWRWITRGNFQYSLASPKRSPIPAERFIHFGVFKAFLPGEEKSPCGGISRGRTLDDLLTEILEPYWENPALPPHHPGFDKPEAALFRRPTSGGVV